MEIHDAFFGILLLYLAVIGGAMLWSVLNGRGHKFGWWDGGNILRGKQLSVRETFLFLALDAILLGFGTYYWLIGLY